MRQATLIARLFYYPQTFAKQNRFSTHLGKGSELLGRKELVAQICFAGRDLPTASQNPHPLKVHRAPHILY
jgi:hypothetical protein